MINGGKCFRAEGYFEGKGPFVNDIPVQIIEWKTNIFFS